MILTVSPSDRPASFALSSTTTAPVYYAPAPQQSAPAAPAPFVPPTPPPPPTVQRTVIAPIDAPEGTILIGSQAVARPEFIDARTAEQFNNSASALQADGANALVNAGLVDAPQADRVAAGAATGIVVGGAIGAAALGVPATAVGAVGGGLTPVSSGYVIGVAVLHAEPLEHLLRAFEAQVAAAGDQQPRQHPRREGRE